MDDLINQIFKLLRMYKKKHDDDDGDDDNFFCLDKVVLCVDMYTNNIDEYNRF
eukprot:UN01868